MPLPSARSARRWSWRRVASTMRAILPGGGLRHREPVFFRWARSRSATKVSVWRDSGGAHCRQAGCPRRAGWLLSQGPNGLPGAPDRQCPHLAGQGAMENFPAAVRRSQLQSSSRLSFARTFSLWRPARSRPARAAACTQVTGPPTSAAAAATASSSDR